MGYFHSCCVNDSADHSSNINTITLLSREHLILICCNNACSMSYRAKCLVQILVGQALMQRNYKPLCLFRLISDYYVIRTKLLLQAWITEWPNCFSGIMLL